MNATQYNAIIGQFGDVIGYTTADSREIEIAGAITTGGAPVNARVHKVSKSQANRAKIVNQMPFTKQHEHNGTVFYTLED